MALTIFEGPDGAGKSTLLRAFEAHARRRAEITHESAHGPYIGQKEIADRYMGDLVLAIPPRRWHVLMDRSWISEQVYGPIARGCCRITVARRRMLERLALAGSGVLVLCQPSYEACQANYLRRKALEYLPTESQLHDVYEAFRGWVTGHVPVPTLHYDYTVHGEQLQDFIQIVNAARPAKNEGPGVGHFGRPGKTILLVGDRVNVNTMAQPYPFISLDQAGCSLWLADQLEAWGVPESRLYWVNAHDPQGRDTSGAFWLELLQPRRVIALGDEARTWCRRYFGNNFTAVPHPQYWKRFHHEQPYPLKEALCS